jgi:hypothetical protein
MQNKTIDRIAEILGYIGRVLVLIGMACGCLIFWKLIITYIIL